MTVGFVPFQTRGLAARIHGSCCLKQLAVRRRHRRHPKHLSRNPDTHKQELLVFFEVADLE